jgi:hypothetical protein
MFAPVQFLRNGMNNGLATRVTLNSVSRGGGEGELSHGDGSASDFSKLLLLGCVLNAKALIPSTPVVGKPVNILL